MLNNWSTVKLGDLIIIDRDSIDQNFKFNEIDYLQISSVSNGEQIKKTESYSLDNAPGRAKRLVKDGDILLSTVRPNLRGFFYVKNPKKNLVVSTGFAVLRPISEFLNNKFLYYVISTHKFTDYLTKNAKGAAYPAIDKETIRRAEIPLPDLETQKEIASTLSAFDDLIENNNRRIEILEEMARLIYREWFVHLRYPGHEQDEFVDSELGKVPKGWDVVKLRDLIQELIPGQSPKSEFYNEDGEGLPFHQGAKDFGKHFPTTSIWCTYPKKVAEKGDILFSVRAPVGRINYAKEKVGIGRGLHAIRPQENRYSFIYHQLRNKFYKENIMGGGTIFSSVSKNEVLSLKMIKPSYDLIGNFEKKIAPIDKQITALSEKNLRLKKVRDLLLPKLVKGEIDIKNNAMSA